MRKLSPSMGIYELKKTREEQEVMYLKKVMYLNKEG